MVSITLTRNFGSLADLVLVTKEDMREIGLLARERIVRRTMAGQDASGSQFKAYVPRYAKQKHEALGTSQVNLQVSGNMLNHITITEIEVTPDVARVRLGWNQ
jgi:hypothetical protein